MDKIKNEHILAAIKEIEANPILRKGRASSTYDLIYDNKDYPPKLVIGLANKYATGKELDPNEFNGGPNTPAFDLLKKEGFTIVEKNDSNNYNVIKEYISKLKSGEVSAAKSIKSLIENNNFENNLKVIDKIFFNNKLKDINSNNYLKNIEFIKEIHNIKSKEYNDFNIWSASKTLLRKTNEDLIKQHNELNILVGFPDNGNGIYKSFLGDNNLLAFLMNKFEKIETKVSPLDGNHFIDTKNEFSFIPFYQNTLEAGLIFSPQLIQRFIASLCTKPFVICSGLSGSGKTKLAQAFAQWITSDESQYVIVPVGADWTNREPLLGFPNALNKEEYVSPENGVLDLMIRAKNQYDIYLADETKIPKPYFLILDEMNLSHVERYFADFLSTMESGGEISLHKIVDASQSIPVSIKLPKNLFIIGTVNIDETTYMFSPKVLDRANTIEFRLTEKDIADFIASDIKLDMDLLKAQGAKMSDGFMAMALQEIDKNLKQSEEDLKLFFSELKKSGAEFGYRTASEIGRLMYMLNELGESGDNLLDIAIMQKLLPKLHGSRNKLTKVLPILGGFCLTDNSKIKEDYLDKFVSNSLTEVELKADTNIKYKISFEKICRMYKNAVENGFASYAEA